MSQIVRRFSVTPITGSLATQLELTSVNDLRVRARAEQLSTGKALDKHVRAVHYGEEDANCPACRELRRKMNG